jgi:F0F1-type ATP synthase assembly protein I
MPTENTVERDERKVKTFISIAAALIIAALVGWHLALTASQLWVTVGWALIVGLLLRVAVRAIVTASVVATMAALRRAAERRIHEHG